MHYYALMFNEILISTFLHKKNAEKLQKKIAEDFELSTTIIEHSFQDEKVEDDLNEHDVYLVTVTKWEENKNAKYKMETLTELINALKAYPEVNASPSIAAHIAYGLQDKTEVKDSYLGQSLEYTTFSNDPDQVLFSALLLANVLDNKGK